VRVYVKCLVFWNLTAAVLCVSVCVCVPVQREQVSLKCLKLLGQSGVANEQYVVYFAYMPLCVFVR
jgi:hypothetical protein